MDGDASDDDRRADSRSAVEREYAAEYRRAFNSAALAALESVCTEHAFLRECYLSRQRYKHNRATYSQAPAADIKRWIAMQQFFDRSRRVPDAPKPTVLDAAMLTRIDPSIRILDDIEHAQALRANRKPEDDRSNRVAQALAKLIAEEQPKKHPKWPERLAAMEVRRMFERRGMDFTSWQAPKDGTASNAALVLGSIIGVDATTQDVRTFLESARAQA
jgi:hypothetical protein